MFLANRQDLEPLTPTAATRAGHVTFSAPSASRRVPYTESIPWGRAHRQEPPSTTQNLPKKERQTIPYQRTDDKRHNQWRPSFGHQEMNRTHNQKKWKPDHQVFGIFYPDGGKQRRAKDPKYHQGDAAHHPFNTSFCSFRKNPKRLPTFVNFQIFLQPLSAVAEVHKR